MAFTPAPWLPDDGGLYNSTPPTALNLRFSPPELIFYWMMSNNAPSNFTADLEFPDLTVNPDFENFTDWKIEVTLAHTFTQFITTDSIPFTRVNGGLTYLGDLGVLTDGNYKKTLTYSFFNLNLLSEGQYNATATYKITAVNPDSALRETIAEKDLLITFNANAYTYSLVPPFAVTYQGREFNFEDFTSTPMIFNYHTGGALPDSQDLYYFIRGASNNAPAAVPTILDISDPLVTAEYAAVHSYFAKLKVELAAGISGLAVGTYDYIIKVGLFGFFATPDVFIEVPVRLNVLPVSTGVLTVDPETLDIEVTIGGETPAASSFYVYSDTPWEVISALPSWLYLSRYNASGTHLVLAGLQNYTSMSPGNYTAQIIISDGVSEVTLTVNFVIHAFITYPFAPGKLFFTKELDYIVVTSSRSNTYLNMQIQIKVFKLENFEPVVYDRAYKLALLNGLGKFHVGTIVHQLFEELSALSEVLPLTDANYVIPSYLPAEVTITYEEEEYIPGTIPFFVGPAGSIGPFTMIQGWKPYITDNNLSLLTVQQQNASRITPKSVICLGFSHFGSPQIVVRRNGIPIEDFTITSLPAASGSNKVLYQYFRAINDLKPGDSLEIFIVNGDDIRTARYTVFPPGLESTFILFRNSNGIMEAYEFTGRRRKSNSYEIQKKTQFKDLFQIEKKLPPNVNPGTTINTGKTLPDDYKIIDQIIKSDEVWIAFDSPFARYVKVDATTTKLSVEDTSDNDNSYDIEFNILENTYAHIYSE